MPLLVTPCRSQGLAAAGRASAPAAGAVAVVPADPADHPTVVSCSGAEASAALSSPLQDGCGVVSCALPSPLCCRHLLLQVSQL